MTDHVILLHGLWMRGFALLLLHRRMMEAGFRVHRFDYMSVAASQPRIRAGRNRLASSSWNSCWPVSGKEGSAVTSGRSVTAGMRKARG